jgi:ABC-type multidrug transport system fused ATPase/permease subunit
MSQIPAMLQGFSSAQFLLALGSLCGFGLVVNIFFCVGISRVGIRAMGFLYEEFASRVHRFPLSFFDSNPVGRVMNRFGSDYETLSKMASGPSGEFLCLVFDIVLVFVLSGLASVYNIPIMVFAFLTCGFVYKRNQNSLRQARRALALTRGPALSHFSETIQGALVIRVFGKEYEFFGRFAKLVGDFVNQRIKTAFAGQRFSLFMSLTTAAITVLAGVINLFLLNAGLTSIGSVGVTLTFVLWSTRSVQALFEWIAAYEEALTALERFEEYLSHPTEANVRIPLASSCGIVVPVENACENEDNRSVAESILCENSVEILIENLSFRYRPEFPLVLRDLSLSVRGGETLGIMGRTGSGKSSLIQAICLLYPLESGRIILGGREPLLGGSHENGISVATYRRAISVIPQDPVLFIGTLRNNVSLIGEYCDEEIISTLEMVGLKRFLQTLPNNPLDAPIFEGGKNISVGQRQLICLARSILSRAPVVLMDEATSAIDPASEEQFAEASRTLLANKTKIVVAHRRSSLIKCDRVAWLHNGGVKMVGSPQSIFDACDML